MWRPLIARNFWLKLGSLALAALFWSVIHFKVMTPFGRPVTHLLRHLPITILTEAHNTDSYQVVPPTINAVVRGPAGIIERLGETDIEVYVNVTGKDPANTLSRRVEVVAPKGVDIIQISPTSVNVIRVPQSIREKTPMRNP
jgi:hypothetical protein